MLTTRVSPLLQCGDALSTCRGHVVWACHVFSRTSAVRAGEDGIIPFVHARTSNYRYFGEAVLEKAYIAVGKRKKRGDIMQPSRGHLLAGLRAFNAASDSFRVGCTHGTHHFVWPPERADGDKRCLSSATAPGPCPLKSHLASASASSAAAAMLAVSAAPCSLLWRRTDSPSASPPLQPGWMETVCPSVHEDRSGSGWIQV